VNNNTILTKYDYHIIILTKGDYIMLRKLGQNFQIALPRNIAHALNLHVNDYLDIELKENKIIIEQQVIVPKTQAYFYTPEWQEHEKSASDDIKTGKTTKTKNLKELFKELDK